MSDYMLRLLAEAERWLKNERGQGMVEYALILVLVSVVAIVVLTAVGVQVNNVLNAVSTTLAG